MTRDRLRAAWQWSLWTARAATAAGLAIDAYVHLDLAPVYAEARGVINEGVLFRAEAVTALLTAAVIATGRRACYLAGLAVGGQRAGPDADGAVRVPAWKERESDEPGLRRMAR